MNPKEFQQAIINFTVQHSGWEKRRAYIGLSGISDCEAIIYERYFHGQQTPSVDAQLTTRLSYELEEDLILRLAEMGIYTPAKPIMLEGGLVQGHPDGLIGQDYLEITTVPLEEHFPLDGRIGRKKYWQVQAYLHYGGPNFCHVMFLARATGAICTVGVRYQPSIGRLIEERVERLVQAVKDRQRPACTCGRCGVVVDKKPLISGMEAGAQAGSGQ